MKPGDLYVVNRHFFVPKFNNGMSFYIQFQKGAIVMFVKTSMNGEIFEFLIPSTGEEFTTHDMRFFDIVT